MKYYPFRVSWLFRLQTLRLYLKLWRHRKDPDAAVARANLRRLFLTGLMYSPVRKGPGSHYPTEDDWTGDPST